MKHERLPKIELWRSPRDKLWRIRLRATNGRLLLTSESYASRGNCNRAAARLAHVLALPITDAAPAPK